MRAFLPFCPVTHQHHPCRSPLYISVCVSLTSTCRCPVNHTLYPNQRSPAAVSNAGFTSVPTHPKSALYLSDSTLLRFCFTFFRSLHISVSNASCFCLYYYISPCLSVFPYQFYLSLLPSLCPFYFFGFCLKLDVSSCLSASLFPSVSLRLWCIQFCVSCVYQSCLLSLSLS